MKNSRTLLVEGWRSILHSYALVNQFQCLQFLAEPNLSLRHRDLPYLNPNWERPTGMLNAAAEEALRQISPPVDGEIPDAVYRISFPLNISNSIARRTVVFGTAEFRAVSSCLLTPARSLREACQSCDASIVTPSHWSREGFLHSGADPERVAVVPHGFDPAIFHPLPPEERAAKRRQRGWNEFVFLNLSAVSRNKCIGKLLRAFAIVALKHRHVRLVMKGIDAVYTSRECLRQEIGTLNPAELRVIYPRSEYLDKTMSFAEVAELYQLADAYVCPYAGEGFNLPALEAIACGLPVICTKGGPTDDFTSDEFALRINSVGVTDKRMFADETAHLLEIDFDHLVHQMMTAVENPAIADKARAAGPAFVANGFTWKQVTRKLLGVLFGEENLDAPA